MVAIDLHPAGSPQARLWGSGWPDAQPAKMQDITWSNGVSPAGGVRREIAELVTLLGNETIRRGYKPHAGWCWGYSNRPIAGTTVASNHSWGLAVDINAPTNPRTANLVTDMPSWMPDLWNKYGFRWGGDYPSPILKDAMHYEFMGDPSQAAVATFEARRDLAPPTVVLPPGPDLPFADGDTMLVTENIDGTPSFWVVNGGKRLSVSAADAKTWVGPTLTITGKNGWDAFTRTFPAS